MSPALSGSTKVTMAFLVAVSFHDGNGSVAPVCARAGRTRSIGNGASTDGIALRLILKIASRDVVMVRSFTLCFG